jgi:DNA polymerase-3 subunit delta
VPLTPEQLEAGIVRRLAPGYLISGDEPLLMQECADLVRRRSRESGFADREVFFVERAFDWPAFEGTLLSLSLFADRRVVELRLPTPKSGDGGAAVLERWAERPPDDLLLLVLAPRLDRRVQQSAWVKALARGGEWVEVRPVDAPALPAWIAGRMRRAGLEPDAEAAGLLAERVEGNLLAAHQEIEKLALLAAGSAVDEVAVRSAVADSARYDVFKLADAALAGDLPRALRILAGLRAEGQEVPAVLWAVAREIRGVARVRWLTDQGMAVQAAMAKSGVWRSRAPLVASAARRHDGRALHRLSRLAAEVDRLAKGSQRGDAWQALTRLLAGLAGGGRRAA